MYYQAYDRPLPDRDYTVAEMNNIIAQAKQIIAQEETEEEIIH
ncbi:hypothetical protein [Anoxybacillus flavithermus]|nr:hypothetical protein [Anoxybacillus flavithermus]